MGKVRYFIGLYLGLMFSSLGCIEEKTYFINNFRADRVEVTTRGNETSVMFFNREGNYRGHLRTKGECEFRFEGDNSELVGGNMD